MAPNATLHVLLVEDDDIDAEVVQRGLATTGSHICLNVVEDGMAALQWLRSQIRQRLALPHLILLDLNLPRMNGVEFLQELRQDPVLRCSIVFVLTTSNLQEDKLAAYEHQVAGYLLKSNLDKDNFVKLAHLLDAYRTLVRFPFALALH